MNNLHGSKTKRNQKWFTVKQHIAYLGKELKKAEIALALGNTGYYQQYLRK